MSHSLARYVGTLAVLLLSVACGGGDERPDGVGPMDEDPQVEPSTEPRPVGPACVEGTTRTCTIWLAKQGDVKNCFVGEQMCIDGAYSECYDPEHPPAAASKKDGETDEEPGDDDKTDEPEDPANPDDDRGNDDDSNDDDSDDDDSDDDDRGNDDDSDDDDRGNDDDSDDDNRGDDDDSDDDDRGDDDGSDS
jgi:hypothetical protein